MLTGFEVAGMYEMAKRLSDYMGREITVEFYETISPAACPRCRPGRCTL